MQRALSVLATAAMLAGCRGCGSTQHEPATHFIAKDAEAVLELKDIRLLVRLREALTKDFGAFVTPAQVDSLRQELALTLGFDPTLDEGLKKAGLRTEGEVAAQIDDGGRSALWVLPVEDAAKFGTTVKEAASSRVGANKVTVEGEITVLAGEFGPQLVTVAAFATKGGVGLLGAGPKAKELVAAALVRKPEDSVASHPEYGKQAGALAKDWDLRVISPSGARAVSNALELLVRVPASVHIPGLDNLKSAGWSASGHQSGIVMQGNLRLDEAGLEKARKLFAASSKLPAGILALDVSSAAAVLQLACDLPALIAVLAPPGSPARLQLDQLFARIKQDIGTDVEGEVLPILSGHGGVAVGAIDLSHLSLRDLQANPFSALWTAFAVGVKDEKTIRTIESRLDPGLKERQFEVGARSAGGQDVRVVAKVDQASGQKATLVETFGKGGAMVFSNEPAVTDLIVANGGGTDLLNGAGGVAVQIRFGVLAKQLQTFPVSSLPALLRGFARKIMDAVGLIDLLAVNAKMADEGIEVRGELKLAPGAK